MNVATYTGINDKGFTLVEVVIAIIIAGILTTVALRSVSTVRNTALDEQTKQELRQLEHAIVGNSRLESNGTRTDFGYLGDVGSLPINLDGLVQNPGGYATWKGPYFKTTIMQDPNDFKRDAWGVDYLYTGSIEIISNGSGSNIVRQFAGTPSELLYNRVSGNIRDLSGRPPGVDFVDSIVVRLIVPDGVGAMTVRSTLLDRGGYFEIDSVPVGSHDLQIIYSPTSDTMRRFTTVLPASAVHAVYKLDSNYFSVSTSQSEIIRPDGPGIVAGLTPSGCVFNWECVDEAAADDATTFVAGSGNSWTSDSYSMQNPSASSGIIDSVLVFMRSVGPGGGLKARTLLHTGGANYTGAQEILTSVVVYTDFSTTYATNPATGLTWTWAEIGSLEIGVDIFKTASCTRVWAIVYYTG